jgi:hypothetical protein
MDKKMIHKLPVSFVDAALIDRYNMMLPKIVHAKNLSKGRRPKKKKNTLKGALVRKMLFQEKREPSLQPRIL